MQYSAKQDLLDCIEGSSNDGTDDELHLEDSSDDTLRYFDKAVNYLLKTYADDGIISANDASINEPKKCENQSPLLLKVVLLTKTSRCGRVYSQGKRIYRLLQRLKECVQHQVRY